MSPTYKSLFFSSSCRYGNRKSHLFTVISALHSLVFIICNPERFQHCPYTHRRKQCWEPRPALAAVARPVCPQRCARPGGRDPPGQGPSQQVACPPSDELCFPAGREGVSWVVSSRQWGTPPIRGHWLPQAWGGDSVSPLSGEGQVLPCRGRPSLPAPSGGSCCVGLDLSEEPSNRFPLLKT